MSKYDVFVSYNNEDREWAERFATELRSLGVRVWFDKWELIAGGNWQDALQTAIPNSASVAILIGRSGLGSWTQAELRQALSNLVKGQCSIIPVILPDVEEFELPPFLQHCHYIDYRDQQTYLGRIENLILGITGQKLTYSLSQIGEEFELPVPYGHQSIRVHTLPNPGSSSKVSLTGETFLQGIEYLHNQIDLCVPRLEAHACIGINDAGLAMAAFLAGSIMGRRSKVGWIKSEGARDRKIVDTDSWFPELPPKPLLLLTDSQLKSGSNLEVIVERLRAEYPEALIYCAVLTALVEGSRPKIDSFDQLCAKPVLDKLKLDGCFIAFTMLKPGIRSPLRVR